MGVLCSWAFSISWSQTNGVVSSAKLQISTSGGAKNKWWIEMLNKSGPRIEPCGTPYSNW